MKHHAFSPRAVAAAAAAMAVLLVAGTTTGAAAAVAATSAPSARQGTPTVPGAPTGLTATPGNGTATLSWSAPSSDGGSPVDDYVIEGGTSPSGGGIEDNVGGHTATIGGLTNGTAYYFRVHAQNAYGDGASVTVKVTPPGSGSVPGSPTGLKTSYGDGFIALSWSPPTSTGGSPITGYHVYLGYSSSFAGAREFTTSGPSFRLTDAENGSQYYIKVTALNAAGEGPATPVTSVIPVPHVVPTRPVAPSGLTARVSHRSVILSWSQPGGGTKVSDYLVYVGTRPIRSFMRSFDEVPDPRVHTYTVTGLPAGAQYYFRVLAVGANSVSLPSNETSVFLGAGTAAGTGASTGSGTTPVSSSGVVTASGAAHGQPSAAGRPGIELAQDSASSGLPAGLVVLLAALVLAAAAGGATAVMLLRRRRYDRRYGPVPAPRRSHDDQPTGPVSRTEELNGPRYR
jgi:Fibronectin type III domain